MNNIIDIKSNVEQVQKSLEKTSKSVASISSGVVRIFCRQTLSGIQKAIRQNFLRHTGQFQKAYTYSVKKEEGSVFPSIKTDYGKKILPITSSQNYGALISPRLEKHFEDGSKERKSLMIFKGKNGFASKKQITIKGKDFLSEGKKQAMSSATDAKISTFIDKALQKYS